MFRATRTRTSFSDLVSVIAVAICLLAFVVYLKAGISHTPVSTSSQTKIWLDPNQASDPHTKIAPVVLIFLPLLLLHFRKVESAEAYVRLPHPFFRNFLVQARYWFRPPPLSSRLLA